MSGHARPVAPSAVPPERLADILTSPRTVSSPSTCGGKSSCSTAGRPRSRVRPAEILGRPLEDLLPPTYRPDHPAQVDGFVRGPDVSRVMGDRRVVVGRRKDGTTFPAEVTISKLDCGGETLLTAIVRDATVRKRYEDALVRLNQELEDRVRARTAELAERNLQLAQKNEENELFVYSVSHDLRSPLVNLEGFSDELRLSQGDLEHLLWDPAIRPTSGTAPRPW